jgi:ATP/maltotriose-dependent transcriptional regulator MalT
MAAGETYVPMDLMNERNAVREAMDTPLSDREYSVLWPLADGLSNREIGADLGLAEPTVKMHVQSICRKLGVNNRTQAVVTARNLNLI